MSVSLAERQATFGASSLSQMTRGNKVPDIGANSGVPTTLPLALSQLAGAVAGSTLAASLNTTSANGSRTTAGVAASNSVTVTASGGTGTGYTYSWHVTTNTGNTISASGPSSATTQFTASVGAGNPSALGMAYCTVTDSGSNTVNTATVNIDLEFAP